MEASLRITSPVGLKCNRVEITLDYGSSENDLLAHEWKVKCVKSVGGSQATELLTMNKYSPQDAEAVQTACFKLNSLQLHTLLTGYLYAPDEPCIPPVNTWTPAGGFFYRLARRSTPNRLLHGDETQDWFYHK